MSPVRYTREFQLNSTRANATGSPDKCLNSDAAFKKNYLAPEA